MNKIVIFAGTTEGRLFSEALAQAGVSHTLCVATDYGELLLKEHPLVSVHKGRMNEEEICAFIRGGAEKVYDATHPYARIVTENIKNACAKEGKEYIRILREKRKGLSAKNDSGRVLYYNDVEECVNFLKDTEGNILLTTGSKDLSKFTKGLGDCERIYARVLPSVESIELCKAAGLEGKHVIAMQGPFSKEMNKALIEQFHIRHMVTKESGSTGGYPEKLMAAEEEGIDLYVIGRPEEESGMTLREALKEYGINPRLKMALVGIGPGNPDYLTERAKAVMEASEIIFGAPRMLEIAEGGAGKKTYPYYLAKDVIPVMEAEEPEMVAVLFSGDSGFFSGAENMKKELEERLDLEIEIVPGISSLSYFSSLIGESYSNAVITSIHGRSESPEAVEELAANVLAKGRVFTLMSGKNDVETICQALTKGGLGLAEIKLGYELSYDDEKVFEFRAEDYKEIIDDLEEGLYVAYIGR